MATDEMEIEELLGQRFGLREIGRVVAWAAGEEDRLRWLWDVARGDRGRRGINALWCMTHLPESESAWLASLQDEMIDMLLAEAHTGRRRMLLQMLREQEYDPESLRADFLDFCMSKLTSECEPYAIRCFSLYAAFRMCRHYPELIAELEQHLDMMTFQELSPGLKSALRQTKKKISRLSFRTAAMPADRQTISGV